MEEKQQFISLLSSGHFTMSALCETFEISRKTGHKWKNRHAAHGMAGLAPQSSAPKSVTCRTDESVEKLIVTERRLHPTWGAKKIRHILGTKYGVKNPPVVSTVGEVLKRYGMVKTRRKRAGIFKVERGTLTVPQRNNHVMAVDFKGWFKLGDGTRCDTLTVSDLHSRFLIKVKVMPDMTVKWTQREFRNVFKRYGLPEIIRVDNGSPFASNGPGGLSKLSVWWIGLGIEVQFSRPGCPQDNGCHERMHRTMKAECCKPSSTNRSAQQQRFNRWKKAFNKDRPHEALGMRTPAEVYQPSPRQYSEHIKPRLYKTGVRLKRVNHAGFIFLDRNTYYISETLAGVEVAIEESTETGWLAVRYANVKLGWLERTPNARLRPPAYAERWESKLASKTDER